LFSTYQIIPTFFGFVNAFSKNISKKIAHDSGCLRHFGVLVKDGHGGITGGNSPAELKNPPERSGPGPKKINSTDSLGAVLPYTIFIHIYFI
jgi:hypothetical protein